MNLSIAADLSKKETPEDDNGSDGVLPPPVPRKLMTNNDALNEHPLRNQLQDLSKLELIELKLQMEEMDLLELDYTERLLSPTTAHPWMRDAFLQITKDKDDLQAKLDISQESTDTDKIFTSSEYHYCQVRQF